MLNNIILNYKRPTVSKYLDESIIDLAEGNMLIPDNFRYRIVEVSERSIARPDLLAIDLYGHPEYGALLCKINGISNPQELNIGDRIVAPLIDDIDRFLYVDDTIDNDDVSSKPQAKQKKEKRAPNEAIVGDSRFKIDKQNRIVVY
jgi:hypothetical protein